MIAIEKCEIQIHLGTCTVANTCSSIILYHLFIIKQANVKFLLVLDKFRKINLEYLVRPLADPEGGFRLLQSSFEF